MAKLAWVENNTIRDVAHSNPSEIYTPEVAAYYTVEVPDEAQNGWELLEGVWTAPIVPTYIDTNTYLHVTYPTLSAVNTQIDLTVSVKFADGSPAPVQSTYYVPVIRLADSKQIAFLTVDFTDGVSNVSFTPTEPGVYIMDTSKIRPIPVSIVVDHPEIIVV